MWDRVASEIILERCPPSRLSDFDRLVARSGGMPRRIYRRLIEYLAGESGSLPNAGCHWWVATRLLEQAQADELWGDYIDIVLIRQGLRGVDVYEAGRSIALAISGDRSVVDAHLEDALYALNSGLVVNDYIGAKLLHLMWQNARAVGYGTPELWPLFEPTMATFGPGHYTEVNDYYWDYEHHAYRIPVLQDAWAKQVDEVIPWRAFVDDLVLLERGQLAGWIHRMQGAQPRNVPGYFDQAFARYERSHPNSPYEPTWSLVAPLAGHLWWYRQAPFEFTVTHADNWLKFDLLDDPGLWMFTWRINGEGPSSEPGLEWTPLGAHDDDVKQQWGEDMISIVAGWLYESHRNLERRGI